MTDILFISPNTDGGVALESVGTLLLASILRSKGLKTDILQFAHFGDLSDFQKFLDTAMQMICEEQPKVVSFYTRCDNYHIVLRLAELLKKQKDVYVVFAGPQADITAFETIRDIPYVDYICCGEGENTVYPFFSSLLRGEPDLSTPGLVYRLDGQVVKNPRPELIRDLDTLPKIDYSILKTDRPVDPETPFPVDVGRGCPFACTYCSTKSFWGRKYRLKSPQRIVEEIKEIHDLFGISYFVFEHDMFTMNRKQVMETCKLLQTLDFPITWKCSARIDCIDKELIDTMVDAGMVSIFMGIESGSARMQQIINKKLNLNVVVDMLSYISSKNISMIASFIYGLPEETEDDISQTMALIAEIAKLKRVRIPTHLCTFLPGTELSRAYLSRLTPAANYSDITGTAAIVECIDLINAHPALFSHFWEYKTDLRTKLEHFEIFWRMWNTVQPVYQYISEKYPSDQLINMYYDFAKANQEILQQTKAMPVSKQLLRLLANDRFIAMFQEDEYYNVMVDFYRMTAVKYSDELKQRRSVTAIYCFSPREIEHKTRLQDYSRNRSIVTYTIQPDETLKILVRNKQ